MPHITEVQFWNLIAGLAVLVVIFGGMGIYIILHSDEYRSDKDTKTESHHR